MPDLMPQPKRRAPRHSERTTRVVLHVVQWFWQLLLYVGCTALMLLLIVAAAGKDIMTW